MSAPPALSAPAAAPGSAPRWRRAAVRGLIGAGVLVIAAGAWLAVRGALAYGETVALREATARFEATLDVAASDAASAASFLDGVSGDAGALAGHAQNLAALTADPVWRAAELIPVAGAQLRATRIGAAELARLTTAGHDVLVAARGVLEPRGAGIDVDAVRAVAPPLQTAVEALADARETLAGVDRASLIGPVASALGALDAAIERTGPALEAAHATAQVAPSMLGADGPRLVLVMLQNPAELRAAGGITGTFVALRADRGVLRLTAQADATAFPPAEEPLLAVPADASTRPDDGVARFVQNITATPDFPLSARLASAWWQVRTGDRADAVIAIDPLVLRPLLGIAGPVQVDGEHIAAEQVVDALLRRPYLERDQDAQARYFEDVTEAVFTAALAAPAEAPGMAFHLAPLIDEGRISVWSAHEAEQAVLARTPAAGMAARLEQQDAHAVLFDDLTGGKLDAYLEASFALETSACRPDGRATAVVTAVLTSRVPAGMELPWMSFPAFGGFAREDVGLRLTALAPRGSVVEGVRVAGDAAPWSAATVVGRPGAAARVTVPPGETVAVEFRFAGPAREAAPALIHTPLVGESPVAVTQGSCG